MEISTVSLGIIEKYDCYGGEDWAGPFFPLGKILTSQFLPHPHFTHPTYDIFKKKLIENIMNACDIKFDVAYCYILNNQSRTNGPINAHLTIAKVMPRYNHDNEKQEALL